MAQISVEHLTFAYDGSFDEVFTDTSFSIDTGWKLGFIGRNGKGKTTFLNLLSGKYEYSGTINSSVIFDYFPYKVSEEDYNNTADELMERWKPNVVSWRVLCELPQLGIAPELLYRPFGQLSFGERTKLMLAVLFSGENEFLLIDEPTNHLDNEARQIVKNYLNRKKGFILVSHDRDILDACIDHVLVLNRATIEVQAGNFSSWWENKEKTDKNARAENEKHAREIEKLETAADRAGRWAERSERTKIGFDPVKEHDRSKDTRAYIGAKTKKMQKRVEAYENRIRREIEEKEGLLKDIEETQDLKLMPLRYHKDRLLRTADFSLRYCDAAANAVRNVTFELKNGDRIALDGANGCGKTSLVKAILACNKDGEAVSSDYGTTGILEVPRNLIISYISQDTSHLKGSLRDFAREKKLDYTLLLALLRQLDFERVLFDKDMELYSEGQKKKVLIASSLLTPAHLYIWDEPLNYIDVYTRMQIEKLLLAFQPTMLFVEHDVRFKETIATGVLHMERN